MAKKRKGRVPGTHGPTGKRKTIAFVLFLRAIMREHQEQGFADEDAIRFSTVEAVVDRYYGGWTPEAERRVAQAERALGTPLRESA